jgi:hypothetical protein
VGTTYTRKLSAKSGRLSRLLENQSSNQQIIEELYLATLTRFPTPEEQSELETWLSGRSERLQALEDLLWSLVASLEFAYNY